MKRSPCCSRGEARSRIEDLLRYGVPFDKDLEGHLDLAQEAAHGARRILHVKGDTAGRAIMAALTEAARATPSIQVLEGWGARDLIIRDGQVAGIELARSTHGRFAPGLVLDASAVVLATGGSGQLYAITTNPRESRGEGIAIAARAGATIADAEFVQFHPTAIDIGRDPAPLATEVAARRRRGAHQRPRRALHARAASGRRAWSPRYRRPRRLSRGDERPRRLPRLPQARRRLRPSTSPPYSPPASRRASIRAASRSRSRRRRTTIWAAC